MRSGRVSVWAQTGHTNPFDPPHFTVSCFLATVGSAQNLGFVLLYTTAISSPLMQRSSFCPQSIATWPPPGPRLNHPPLPSQPNPPPPHNVHSNINFSICPRPSVTSVPLAETATWQGDRLNWRVFCTEDHRSMTLERTGEKKKEGKKKG